MSKQWRCAVVGVSVVGKIHVKVLDQLPNTSLAACCDLLPDRAQSILAEQGVSGVPVYKDLGEMLAKEKLDVIHLATPSGLHMDPSIQAMQAGVSVIVEKPIEILVDRIDRMNEAAKALTRFTGPASHWRTSTAWTLWFMTAPPPSSFHVPRQPPC